MASRHFKWKQVGNTASRLNRMLSGDQYRLPTKFVPAIKDRSESVDKMFNNSRSRMHSSLELTALNQTMEEEIPPLIQKTSKLDIKGKREDERVSSLNSVLPNFHQKNSTMIKEPSSKHNSLLVAEIKKEYLVFKKNILIQLDRQREMIQKVIKEVLLTVEIEIQKMTTITLESKKNQINSAIEEGEKDRKDVKTLEEWKKKLKNVQITEQPSENQIISKNQHFLPLKINTLQEKQKNIEPPKPPVSLDIYMSSIDKLKKRVEDMDAIFHQTIEKVKATAV